MEKIRHLQIRSWTMPGGKTLLVSSKSPTTVGEMERMRLAMIPQVLAEWRPPEVKFQNSPDADFHEILTGFIQRALPQGFGLSEVSLSEVPGGTPQMKFL